MTSRGRERERERERGVRHRERGLEREGDGESYGKRRSERGWRYEGKWRDEEQRLRINV